MFDWDDARVFLALHRSGTLSAAGRALQLNQSTVGRRLEALERGLGARLFLRTRDGYRLSPAGDQLLPRAERIEAEADAIARELAGRPDHLTGTVRVTTPDAFGPLVIGPILAAFHALHPALEIEADADNRLRSLSKREAEVSVRLGRPTEAQLVGRKLCDFASAPYCAPSYLAGRKRPRPPFDGCDFLAEAGEGTLEVKWAEQQAAHGRIVARSPNTFMLAELARAGVGVALLPCYLADGDPALVRLGPPSSTVRRQVWLVVHRDLQHSARVRACADFIASHVKAQASRIDGTARPLARSST